MKFIKTKTQFVGFHSWPDAPPETDFLKDRHRHIFIISAKVEVLHNNRDVEFFHLQDDIVYWLENNVNKHDVGSCESLAERLLESLETRYLKRKIEITVSEDGESEGIVNNYE